MGNMSAWKATYLGGLAKSQLPTRTCTPPRRATALAVAMNRQAAGLTRIACAATRKGTAPVERQDVQRELHISPSKCGRRTQYRSDASTVAPSLGATQSTVQ